MPDRKTSTLWGRLIALPVDSTPKTILVAVTLCLFCSMIVAFAAVNLRPIQMYNKALDKKVNILQVAGLYDEGVDVGAVFASFEPRIVDMRTGKFTDAVDIATFDERAAAKDLSMSTELVDDPASIGRKPNFT
ncbi:Na(+)-translocating NADH-quinone reductase subunit C, partial [Alphaproteobacteria bacterium]|nr:Na(+)-translocating NADH-quinone reductase subunit C [Alphaproteobacteria bacterium]